MGMPWVKLWIGFLDEYVIGTLPDSIQLLYIRVLLLAAREDDDG